LLPKTFELFYISNILTLSEPDEGYSTLSEPDEGYSTLSEPDEGYSRIVSFALNLLSTFLLS
jgi:hypothetical protein